MKIQFQTFTAVLLVSVISLASCNMQKQLTRHASKVINDSALINAHIGISIFDPSSGKYLYNYQGDKYFVPASNTKIPTCYAAMKYLDKVLVGAEVMEDDTSIVVFPTGDPTLLHPDFTDHPVYNKLRSSTKKIYISQQHWRDDPWASGWSWNDFSEYYMAERSALPVYGNVIKWIQEIADTTQPAVIYSIPEINWQVNFSTENSRVFSARRDLSSNTFTLNQGKEKKREIQVPYITNGVASAAELLGSELEKPVSVISKWRPPTGIINIPSQPLDSVLMRMMHRSDNFFAEQLLLMVSYKKLAYMSDNRIIDTLLKNDLAGMPQRARWVDGSGLSRYNLFTPQDMIFILNRISNEFGMERVRVIFPTGNEGTLTNYYRADSSYIFAKTGTLSGVVAISGYLVTNKKRPLIFSVLVNNHNTSAAAVRRAVERFLQGIRERY